MNMDIKPLYRPSRHMLELTEEISALRAEIAASPIKISYRPMLQKEAAVRNAMGSTAIEGFVLSLAEVKALASGKKSGTYMTGSEKAVFNYLAALRYIQNSKAAAIKEQEILKLHQITAKGAIEAGEVGQYRKVQNYVVSASGNVIYRPPPASQVPVLMKAFIKWINKNSKEHIPVIASGIVHYEFVRIHPFTDGNGRVARLLGVWELFRRKFDTLHIFATDDIIYEHKKNYYKSLASASKGDLTGWLEYYLEIVAESLLRARKRLAGLPKTEGETEIFLNPKQEKLLSVLKDAGKLSAKEIALILKVTVQGAHFIMKDMIKAGIIRRFGGRKTGKYGT